MGPVKGPARCLRWALRLEDECRAGGGEEAHASLLQHKARTNASSGSRDRASSARPSSPREDFEGGWGWGGSGGWGGGTVSLAAARVILEEVEEQAEEKKHLLAFRSSLHRPRPRPPCPHRGVKMW